MQAGVAAGVPTWYIAGTDEFTRQCFMPLVPRPFTPGLCRTSLLSGTDLHWIWPGNRVVFLCKQLERATWIFLRFWVRYSTKSYKKAANAKLAHQWFGGNFELWEQTPTWSVLCIVQPQHALSRTGSFKSGFIVSSNRSKNLLEVGSGYTSAVP